MQDEPVRGAHAYLDDPRLFGLSGLDQLRVFIDHRAPQPPVQRLSGLTLVGAEPAASTWSMPASPWWQTPVGLFPAGALSFAADGALAGAIYAALPPAIGFITSELSAHFLRPATPASERLVARGSLIHLGRRQGLSEARVEDGAGRLLAHATSRCLLLPLPFAPPPVDLDAFGRVERASDAESDPHRRPVELDAIPQHVWDSTPGLDILRASLGRERTLAPICRFTGWRLVEVEEGAATWTMPASRWFTTGFGTFYGGALAALADGALSAAVTTTLPPATSFGTLDLKVNFLRPVTADERPLTARATVVRRGQTIAVSTATIEDADGKVAVMATSSAMLLPGRPWVAGSADVDDRDAAAAGG